jgi:geranylgeranyl diphosphate synthase type II
MDLREYLEKKKAIIDRVLDQVLPGETEFPPRLHQAMRYCVLAGGKRLRPILAIAAAEAVGGSGDAILPGACALELIHTYSLIHDDLPAMDNDDYRRGLPTTHKVYGEAMAILAGDALLTEAFALLSASLSQGNWQAYDSIEVIRMLSAAAGSRGLIGGQVVDLESEGKAIDEHLLDYMHTHKTGCLITASVLLGARLAGASPEQLTCLRKYGETIGLAFQITDDILDVTESTQTLGKTAGSDQKKKKATYPALHGIDDARKRQQSLYEAARDAIQPFDEKADPLRFISRYIIERTA